MNVLDIELCYNLQFIQTHSIHLTDSTILLKHCNWRLVNFIRSFRVFFSSLFYFFLFLSINSQFNSILPQTLENHVWSVIDLSGMYSASTVISMKTVKSWFANLKLKALGMGTVYCDWSECWAVRGTFSTKTSLEFTVRQSLKLKSKVQTTQLSMKYTLPTIYE